MAKALKYVLGEGPSTQKDLIELFEKMDTPSCAKTATGLFSTFKKDFKGMALVLLGTWLWVIIS